MRKHHKLASWRHAVPGASLACGMVLVLGSIGGEPGGASRLSHALLTLCAVLAGLYCVASLGAALSAAARSGWRYSPILPAVFATFHVSYGMGFLLGLSHRPASRVPFARADCVRE